MTTNASHSSDQPGAQRDQGTRVRDLVGLLVVASIAFGLGVVVPRARIASAPEAAQVSSVAVTCQYDPQTRELMVRYTVDAGLPQRILGLRIMAMPASIVEDRSIWPADEAVTFVVHELEPASRYLMYIQDRDGRIAARSQLFGCPHSP